MIFKIEILNNKDEIIKSKEGSNEIYLVYDKKYELGDYIKVSSSKKGFVIAQIEDTIEPSFGLLKNDYKIIIPFDGKKRNYSPKNFSGELHILKVREAMEEEIKIRKNLALNPMDCHENIGFFPHGTANVETRGESVFAARNAINGNKANDSHGDWPYESWGINKNPDAEIKIDFGRIVNIDEIIITLRADFPHDNWWEEAEILFSDGSIENINLEKEAKSQIFSIAPRNVTWAIMRKMIQNPNDPSPFPALTQIEFWGTEK